MKNLKIRFVKSKDDYQIQKRSMFRWRYINYGVGSIEGTIYYPYQGKVKEELLDKVLAEKYMTTREFVRIEEHPEVKVY